MVMPRPDLEKLNVRYRRIPVLAHGRHVYCDTRRIIEHLEAAFPPSPQHPSIVPKTPFEQGVARLLEKWVIESGIFPAAASLLPPDLPALKNPQFQKDREQLSGRSWKREDILANRAAATLVIRDAFLILEEQVLGDGRAWVLGGQGPSIADLEAVWPFEWLVGIPGALDKEVISATLFPRAFDWVKRFGAAAKAAGKKAKKPTRLNGAEATKQVLNCDSQPTGFRFDVHDPVKLSLGTTVEAYPTDSGFANRDSGRLVGLDKHEVVLETKAPSGEVVYIHHPRRSFKVRKVGGSKL